PQADHSVLHSGYFTNLQHLESLPSEAKHALLRERGEMIRVLAGLLSTKHGSPEFSINNHQTQEGDTMSQAPKNFFKHDLKGATFTGGLVEGDKVKVERIGGDIYNNYSPEQKQNLADAAAEIQQLLQQLEQSYPNATQIERQSAIAVTLQQEIKQNPTLRARLKNALKEGGIEALKVLFAPIGIPIEMVRGWIEAE
ncbi:MAG: hypothetical protein F6K41_17975, partial [Symploca sp. SIO3E6]|nr:hypothetical protein [Caldora sp. SIO3E6]